MPSRPRRRTFWRMIAPWQKGPAPAGLRRWRGRLCPAPGLPAGDRGRPARAGARPAGGVGRNRRPNERQCPCPVAERVAHQVRLEVEHPVAKARVRARATVVRLVRVQNDGMPPGAVGARAAIVEGLHTVQRIADGVGVVAVRIVGVAREESLYPLQARLRRRLPDPVAGRGAARSFKTGPSALVQSRAHALLHPKGSWATKATS